MALREPLPFPGALHALVGDRLSALPARTHELILLAALAIQCTVEFLARALDKDPWELLRPAIEADVIEIDGAGIRFAHPLLALAA